MKRKLTRRDFAKLAALTLPASSALAAAVNSTVHGVKLGAITFSFHDLKRTPGEDTVDGCIEDLVYAGCQYCELMATDVEPAGAGGRGGRGQTSPGQQAAREALRKWRIETPTAHFGTVRKKFSDAGITVYAYTVNYNDQFSDEELDASFGHAKALGTNLISSSTTITMARRLVPFAEKNKMNVAFHGHANTSDPNQFSSPDTFAKALSMSKYYRINLDIGHFTAAGFDPLPFIAENHRNITHLHMKDMKKNVEQNLPWGQGDVPIREILLLLSKNKYPIAAIDEMAYPVQVPTRDEVRKNMDAMRAMLS